MTPAEQLFRVLALCTQRPGNPETSAQLPQALAAVSHVELVEQAVQHGLAPLLLGHLRHAKTAIAPSLSLQLYAQQVLHTRRASVRRRVVGEAVTALNEAQIPLLVLKGTALAPLVYGDPAWRPMRDVDLLVRPTDASRAYATLRGRGFTLGERATAPGHHHLPALLKEDDDVVIVIELHHELLARTPCVAPLLYDDLRPSAQTFEWNGLTLQTLGREEMLWHVYAHAFVINTLAPGMRLISIADLVHATEAWVELLDWERLRLRYGQLVRALALLHQVTPWSNRVAAVLRSQARREWSDLRPLSSSLHWSGAASRDVLWPPEWWFRMRYGVDGPLRWLWYRAIGHPLRLTLSATATVSRRVSHQLRGPRSHRLLAGRE